MTDRGTAQQPAKECDNIVLKADRGDVYKELIGVYQRPLIQEMMPGEEKETSEMIETVFNELVAPGYSEEGRKTFLDYIEPVFIAKRMQDPNYFLLTAKESEKIVGALGIRDFHHVSLLFVVKDYQRKGIARGLLEKARERIKNSGHDLMPFTVNSSPYAVPVYRRLGFQPVGEEQLTNGIIYQPMRLELEQQQSI